MFRFAGAVAAVMLVVAACGNDSGPSGPKYAASGGNGGASGSGAGAAGVAGVGFGGAGGNGGSVSVDSGNSGGSAGSVTGDACAGFDLAPETIEITEEIEITEVEPVALYLMVDQSGSMVGPNWVTAVNAITTFVNDPSSANLDVAIQFFPPIFPDCNKQTYANPAVPLGRLPAHAPAIIGEVNNHAPFGIGTPIEAALGGAEMFCSNFKTLPNRDPADEDCIVVFITDGEPTECSADFNTISKLAADAWQNSQVRTYAIGMDGTNFTLLDQIATSGNTDCDPNGPAAACNATSGSAGLSAALANIRDKVTKKVTKKKTVTTPLECEWGIPAPPPGETFDPAQVNVDLLANGQKQRLGQVASATDCATHSNGWYYDNPAAPTRIIACPDTCTAVKGTGVAGVSIALGCATEPAVPR
jgi:hypothetical protein